MKKKYDGGRKRRDLIKLGRCLTNANEGNDVVRKIEGGKEKHRAPFFFYCCIKTAWQVIFGSSCKHARGEKRKKSKNANKQSWKHKVEANLEARWLNTSSML
jgi:hypothetical protein